MAGSEGGSHLDEASFESDFDSLVSVHESDFPEDTRSSLHLFISCGSSDAENISQILCAHLCERQVNLCAYRKFSSDVPWQCFDHDTAVYECQNILVFTHGVDSEDMQAFLEELDKSKFELQVFFLTAPSQLQDIQKMVAAHTSRTLIGYRFEILSVPEFDINNAAKLLAYFSVIEKFETELQKEGAFPGLPDYALSESLRSNLHEASVYVPAKAPAARSLLGLEEADRISGFLKSSSSKKILILSAQYDFIQNVLYHLLKGEVFNANDLTMERILDRSGAVNLLYFNLCAIPLEDIRIYRERIREKGGFYIIGYKFESGIPSSKSMSNFYKTCCFFLRHYMPEFGVTADGMKDEDVSFHHDQFLYITKKLREALREKGLRHLMRKRLTESETESGFLFLIELPSVLPGATKSFIWEAITHILDVGGEMKMRVVILTAGVSLPTQFSEDLVQMINVPAENPVQAEKVSSHPKLKLTNKRRKRLIGQLPGGGDARSIYDRLEDILHSMHDLIPVFFAKMLLWFLISLGSDGFSSEKKQKMFESVWRLVESNFELILCSGHVIYLYHIHREEARSAMFLDLRSKKAVILLVRGILTGYVLDMNLFDREQSVFFRAFKHMQALKMAVKCAFILHGATNLPDDLKTKITNLVEKPEILVTAFASKKTSVLKEIWLSASTGELEYQEKGLEIIASVFKVRSSSHGRFNILNAYSLMFFVPGGAPVRNIIASHLGWKLLHLPDESRNSHKGYQRLIFDRYQETLTKKDAIVVGSTKIQYFVRLDPANSPARLFMRESLSSVQYKTVFSSLEIVHTNVDFITVEISHTLFGVIDATTLEIVRLTDVSPTDEPPALELVPEGSESSEADEFGGRNIEKVYSEMKNTYKQTELLFSQFYFVDGSRIVIAVRKVLNRQCLEFEWFDISTGKSSRKQALDYETIFAGLEAGSQVPWGGVAEGKWGDIVFHIFCGAFWVSIKESDVVNKDLLHKKTRITRKKMFLQHVAVKTSVAGTVFVGYSEDFFRANVFRRNGGYICRLELRDNDCFCPDAFATALVRNELNVFFGTRSGSIVQHISSKPSDRTKIYQISDSPILLLVFAENNDKYIGCKLGDGRFMLVDVLTGTVRQTVSIGSEVSSLRFWMFDKVLKLCVLNHYGTLSVLVAGLSGRKTMAERILSGTTPSANILRHLDSSRALTGTRSGKPTRMFRNGMSTLSRHARTMAASAVPPKLRNSAHRRNMKLILAPSQQKMVTSVCISPDSRKMAVCCLGESKIILRNLHSHDEAFISDKHNGHQENPVIAVFSRSSALLASGGTAGMVCIWNVAAHPFLVASYRHGIHAIVSLAFDPYGHWLSSCDANQEMQVWKIRTNSIGKRVKQFSNWKSNALSKLSKKRNRKKQQEESEEAVESHLSRSPRKITRQERMLEKRLSPELFTFFKSFKEKLPELPHDTVLHMALESLKPDQNQRIQNVGSTKTFHNGDFVLGPGTKLTGVPGDKLRVCFSNGPSSLIALANNGDEQGLQLLQLNYEGLKNHQPIFKRVGVLSKKDIFGMPVRTASFSQKGDMLVLGGPFDTKRSTSLVVLFKVKWDLNLEEAKPIAMCQFFVNGFPEYLYVGLSLNNRYLAVSCRGATTQFFDIQRGNHLLPKLWDDGKAGDLLFHEVERAQKERQSVPLVRQTVIGSMRRLQSDRISIQREHHSLYLERSKNQFQTHCHSHVGAAMQTAPSLNGFSNGLVHNFHYKSVDHAQELSFWDSEKTFAFEGMVVDNYDHSKSVLVIDKSVEVFKNIIIN